MVFRRPKSESCVYRAWTKELSVWIAKSFQFLLVKRLHFWEFMKVLDRGGEKLPPSPLFPTAANQLDGQSCLILYSGEFEVEEGGFKCPLYTSIHPPPPPPPVGWNDFGRRKNWTLLCQIVLGPTFKISLCNVAF